MYKHNLKHGSDTRSWNNATIQKKIRIFRTILDNTGYIKIRRKKKQSQILFSNANKSLWFAKKKKTETNILKCLYNSFMWCMQRTRLNFSRAAIYMMLEPICIYSWCNSNINKPEFRIEEKCHFSSVCECASALVRTRAIHTETHTKHTYGSRNRLFRYSIDKQTKRQRLYMHTLFQGFTHVRCVHNERTAIAFLIHQYKLTNT